MLLFDYDTSNRLARYCSRIPLTRSFVAAALTLATARCSPARPSAGRGGPGGSAGLLGLLFCPCFVLHESIFHKLLTSVVGIYGVFFMIAYLMMAGHFADFLFTGTGVLLFLIISALMRPFEYSINKPARETVYTTLKKSEKYRSTVFIDTFINRFGDASGGLLFNILLTLGLALAVAPLAILPLALILSGFGVNISKSVKEVRQSLPFLWDNVSEPPLIRLMII